MVVTIRHDSECEMLLQSSKDEQLMMMKKRLGMQYGENNENVDDINGEGVCLGF